MSVARKRSHPVKSPGGRDERPKESTDLASEYPAAVPQAVKKHRWRNRKSVRRKFKPISVSGVTLFGNSETSIAENLPKPAKWSIVRQSGGIFNPKTLFSNDEKYLLVATDKVVKVVGVRTGQTIRHLGLVHDNGRIVDFTLDPRNKFRLLVAYDTRILSIFDWTDGLLIMQFDLPKVPRHLSVVTSTLLLLTSSKLLTLNLTPSNGTASQCAANEVLDLACGHNAERFMAVDNKSSTVCVAVDTKVYVAVDEATDLPTKITSLACTVDTIIVGEQSGVIRLYFDVIKSLDSNRIPAETLINWHQSPLATLQVSRNGLYLLSGGQEDVLLISHIATGQRQFLSRLGSRVTGIGQTASGSLYSLSLANNVIKVINAGDLQVISEVPGIRPISPSSFERRRGDLPVALLHPRKQHLYLSADTDDAGTIQGYDFWLDQHALRLDAAPISRTRMVGKDQREVLQSKITHSTFTFDGSWLITVDEWDDLYSLDESTATETNLKFWAWNGRNWEILTKIEEPHGIRRRVLALTGQRCLNECATLGTTGDIKVWRLLDSASNNSASGVWSLHRHIGSHNPNVSRSEGSLVYSVDGSLLIASAGIELLIIDTSSGHVVRCIHLGRPTSSVSILGRQLLCLHPGIPMLSAWDIPTGQATFSERLNGRCSILAVNHSRSTFAFSTSNSSTSRSSITISQLIGTEKLDLAQIALDSFAAVLLSAEFPDFSGYVVIDQLGQITCLAPEHAGSQSSTDVGSHHGSTLSPPSSLRKRDVGKGFEISHQKDFRAHDIRTIVGISETIDLAVLYESIVEKIV